MADSFSIKQLQASVTINPQSSTPTFNGSDSNTVTFGGADQSAVEMRADVHNAGGLDGKLELAVCGLPLNIMNQLSTFGTQLNLLPKNQIVLMAGDSSAPLSQAWSGSIIASIIDFDQPRVGMKITANVAVAFAAGSAPPASYNGAADIPTVMQQIATGMGLKFENNGVTGTLQNCYLWGSLRDQYNMVREHADISATIDRGVLAIWPKFKNRNGQPVTLSPADGSLIGYPTYTAYGIQLRALYNSSFAIGQQVTVKGSQIQNANAKWNVYCVNHALESQVDSGKWETTLLATAPNFPTPVV